MTHIPMNIIEFRFDEEGSTTQIAFLLWKGEF